ncbi:MAG: serine/threonine protein kinase, partial [Oscillospiraceae bacterium]|nr:serine/threonine protein kinase [Oscillospiraceae bacterium]
MLQIGSLVDGKYKILNKVGQGGMSVVYLAMNEKANKQWAVKEVRKDGVLDFEAVKQGLVAETDILKRLDHPYLPSIIDVIDTDESFIIIMDYIQGNSLNKALDEFGAQPQDEVIKWAKQLCDVLGYLHTRTPPIIYRDMKPANVMLKPDGNISLIDFGTAREYKEKNLADTTCLGTVGYAAPEQFGGMGQTDARTDIYCLGATLYHLVTGKNPCEPPYEIRPIREINPNLSSGLERIILKCTQRDPNDRYQSAAELMYALEHYEEVDDSYRKKQKRKLALFLAPVVLALLFAGASVWGYLSAEKQRT